MLEDDSQCAEMLRSFLESHSFQVTCVTNGADGVRQILDQDFDVLLCDLFMPHLPGDMFYMAVERTKPRLCARFLFITGYGANPKYEGFIRKVKAPVLLKPFPMSELLGVIYGILMKDCFATGQARHNPDLICALQ